MDSGAATKVTLWFYVMLILYYKIISISIVEHNKQIEKSNEYMLTNMYFLREWSSLVGMSLLHPHPQANLRELRGKEGRKSWRRAVKCLLDMTDITLMNTEEL